jgi:hypothetical protein
VELLEKEWDQWVLAGSPSQLTPADQMLADNGNLTIRSQTPDGTRELGEPTEQPPAASTPAKTVVLSRSNLQRPLVVRPATDTGSGVPMAEKPIRRPLRQDAPR